MAARALVQAWGMLLALSFSTTALTLVDRPVATRMGIAVLVLVLAGVKARIILARYLGLAASHFWTWAFDVALGLFIAIAVAIYLIGKGG